MVNMASINYTTTIIYFVLLYFIAFESAKETQYRDYKTKEAIIGYSTELECSVDEPSINSKWEHVPVGEEILITVTSFNTLNQNYARRYYISSSGHYNLLIKNVHREDAGMYLCRDENHTPKKLIKVELIVLESPPICSTNLQSTEVVVGDNSCGTEPDALKLSCKVKFFGNVPPLLKWKEFADKYNNATTTGDTVSNSILSSAAWNQTAYTCQTSLQDHPCFIVISRPLYVFNTSMNITINWPQSVTCSANSSQPCLYKWFVGDKEIAHSQTLELTPESSAGDYRCVAECSIRGKSCPVQPLIVNYNYVPNTCQYSYGHLVGSNSITAILSILVTALVLTFSFQINFNLYGKTDPIRKYLKSVYRRIRRRSDYRWLPTTDDVCVLDWKSIQTPNIVQTIATPGLIKGVTILGTKLYIVRLKSTNIEEYNLESNDDPYLWPVTDLKEPIDLISSSQNKFLYVSDCIRHAVYRVSMLNDAATQKWFINQQPEGLSLTAEAHVLVACPVEKKFIEFTSVGKIVREVMLPAAIDYPRHALMISENKFLVCHGIGKEHTVYLIKNSDDNNNGTIEETYNGEGIEYLEEKNMWFTRAAQTKTGFIVVLSHQKVLLLDSKLSLVKVLISADASHFPNRMFLDEDRNRLYLTENEVKGRILICDLIHSELKPRLLTLN